MLSGIRFVSVRKVLGLLPVYVAMIAFTAHSQGVFKTVEIDGTAKVQASGENKWESLVIGEEIEGNSMVETFFKSRLILNYGSDNTLIFGPDSKVLLKVKEGEEGKELDSLKLTVFSGGLLMNSVSGVHVTVFSSNAVAIMDSGSVSTIVQSDAEHTGFQNIGGKAEVRNVSEKNTVTLNEGNTSVVLPDKKPSAPLYITHRHASVLKQFYGQEIVENQIDKNNIEPTENKSRGGTGTGQAYMEGQSVDQNVGVQKKVFSKDQIFGKVYEIQKEEEGRIYRDYEKPEYMKDAKGELRFTSDFGISAAGAYPGFTLAGGFNLSNFRAGLRLPLYKRAQTGMSMGFSSFAGVLDKIDYIKINSSNGVFKTGLQSIENLTLGTGTVVRRFKGHNDYSALKPLGLKLNVENRYLDCNLFISDISNFRTGGAHLLFMPGGAWIGAGYYYDADQYESGLGREDSRYTVRPFSDEEYEISSPEDNYGVHILEGDFGAEYYVKKWLGFRGVMVFSAMFGEGSGWVIEPSLKINYREFSFGIGYHSETGQMMSGLFGPGYQTHKTIIDSVVADSVYVNSLSGILNNEREANGFNVFFNSSPVKGLYITAEYTQDIVTRRTYETDPDTSSELTDNNFEYRVSVCANDSLIPYIKYIDLYAQQTKGGYIPKGASFFASWSTEAGLDVMTIPLFFDIGIEGGIKFTYLDINHDLDEPEMYSRIDNTDYLVDFYIGVRWYFL